MWQGLGMTSPGLQRGKEDSWRCPDWRGMGLPVMQTYRGVQAEVQHNVLACLKKKTGGEGVEGWPQFLPPYTRTFSGNGLDCFTHPGSVTVPAQSPPPVSYCLACMFWHRLASHLRLLGGMVSVA